MIRKVEICENEHTLCVDFEALSNNLPSDFTIIVKSKEFKVHKSVLSAQSVFMKMILFEMKESADNKVEIKDVEPSSFEKFLQFIYCEKVPEDLQHYAIDLFVLADKVCLKIISFRRS